MVPMNNNKCLQHLGLRQGVSIAEIKKAYRNLALKYHPDKNSSAKYNEKFKLITEAYKTLRVNYKKDHGQNSGTKYGNKTSNKKYDFIPRKLLLDFYLNFVYGKKNWNTYTTYLENAYDEFCKCEKTFWECFDKVKQSTNSMIHEIIT